jgi:KTSC domain
MPTPEEFRDSFTAGWESWLSQQPEMHQDVAENVYDPVVPRGAPLGQFPPDLKGAELQYGTLQEFLFGAEWLYVTSSWVRAIQYHDKTEDLTIEFLNGAVCQYHGVTVDMAWDFATAPSKGRWVHEHLIPWDYVLLSVGISGPEAKTPKNTRRFIGEGWTKVPGPRQINQFTVKPPGQKRTYDPSKGRRRF